MTDKEKLKKALEALGLIETSTWDSMRSTKDFAGRVYAELTQPRVETVEVKRWYCPICDTFERQPYTCLKSGEHELTPVTFPVQRPIPEPEEEEWEVVMKQGLTGLAEPDRYFPREWIGSRVKVRRVGG